MIKTIARRLFLTALAFFLAAPLVVVTAVSFNGTQRINFPPQNTSFIWYATFFGDPAWMAAFARSLIIAASAAATAVSIAFPIAYAIWKYQSRLARFLETVARLSFSAAGHRAGYRLSGVLELARPCRADRGHHPQPRRRLRHPAPGDDRPGLPLRRSGPRRSRPDHGRPGSDVLRTVLRPIVLPYIVSGLLFVFILSLNEYIIAYMVAGFEVETLPIKVLNNLRMGFQPTMCVGAVLFMLVGVFAFSAVALIGNLPKLLGGRN